MTHTDHMRLIARGIIQDIGGVWADFGSGEGAFTLALRDLAGKNVKIFSVDKNRKSLEVQRNTFEEMFPGTAIQYIPSDFTDDVRLPPLDGFIAANSIHFHKDPVRTLKILSNYLKPGGRCIIIEYNANVGNMWVPHPFSKERFYTIAEHAGLKDVKILSTIPSRFLNEIYAGIAYKR